MILPSDIKKFRSSEVQTCGGCRGQGHIWKDNYPAPPSEQGQYKATCPLCKGTGLVNVAKATTVTITPFTPDSATE